MVQIKCVPPPYTYGQASCNSFADSIFVLDRFFNDTRKLLWNIFSCILGSFCWFTHSVVYVESVQKIPILFWQYNFHILAIQRFLVTLSQKLWIRFTKTSNSALMKCCSLFEGGEVMEFLHWNACRPTAFSLYLSTLYPLLKLQLQCINVKVAHLPKTLLLEKTC